MENSAVIKNFARMCNDGWKQGWHERNGGNLSYRMTKNEVLDCIGDFDRKAEYKPLGVSAPSFGGEHFVVTGSGKFMRNVQDAPEKNLCVIQLDPTGSAYRVVWGLTNGGSPTSELASHILNHAVKAELTEGECRVMYHAHPANIVAMSYVLPLTDKAISRALWQSETESVMVFPQGIGVVGCMVPGSNELAAISSEKMRIYDAVVWAHHGLFCSGSSFDSTFGLMHTVEKAAEIYVKVQSMGGAKQKISDSELMDIAAAHGLDINQAFLEEAAL